MNKFMALSILVISILVIYFFYGPNTNENIEPTPDFKTNNLELIKPVVLTKKVEETSNFKFNQDSSGPTLSKEQLNQKERKLLRKKIFSLTQDRTNKKRYVELGELMDKMASDTDFPPGTLIDVKKMKHNLKISQEIAKLSGELFNGEKQDYEDSAKNIEKLMDLQKKFVVPTYSNQIKEADLN